MQINEISGAVVDAAMKVHSHLGPGLLESVYESCLAYELRNRGLNVQTQAPLPVIYEGMTMNIGYRLDVLVQGCVIVELKAVERLEPLHEAQLLTYLKLSRLPVGLLINFNSIHLRNGARRLAGKTFQGCRNSLGEPPQTA